MAAKLLCCALVAVVAAAPDQAKRHLNDGKKKATGKTWRVTGGFQYKKGDAVDVVANKVNLLLTATNPL